MSTGASLRLAVLGDSIAYGQGAARPDHAVGPRLAAALHADGISVTVRVVAVPGARSDALAGQVRRALPDGPQLAVVIIGANDLTHFVPPDVAARQLGDAVAALTGGGTRVVVAPAPDLSAVPWVPVQFRGLVRQGSAALRQAQTRAALAHGARVADVEGTAAHRFAKDRTLFSADQFHPSSAGYALIAETLLPAVRAAADEVLAA
ncbi:MAG: SGNH/GDSL hydrolase family protein [Jatrophihabitans sp.]|uniref:SGNH/GDSL hydrolase family protein n=1 Tax=Jatrophihabitans sp. TaxID=1932789 RepID=UPI003F7E7F23